jgi:ABC-type multidrug transport system fused ATPase/permease subunit
MYSEELIQSATETITKGRTSIIIAHRLATIMNADQIVVMNQGLIVEQGTHSELIAQESGFYKNLYDSQFILNT